MDKSMASHHFQQLIQFWLAEVFFVCVVLKRTQWRPGQQSSHTLAVWGENLTSRHSGLQSQTE